MLAAVKVPYTRGRTNLDQALRYARRSLLRNITRLLQPRLFAALVTSAKELYFIFFKFIMHETNSLHNEYKNSTTYAVGSWATAWTDEPLVIYSPVSVC